MLSGRRRALIGCGKAAKVVWPIAVEVPMRLNRICNGGSIYDKNDWRSSGYIPVPDGATRVTFSNVDATASQYGRVGATTSDTQTTGITMLAFNQNIVYTPNDRYASIPKGSTFVYASRSGTNTSSIIVAFDNK